MSKTRLTQIGIYLSAILLFAFFFYLYTNYQPQIVAGNGYGWDGLEYHKYYGLFSNGSSAEVSYPFCNRIAVPYLASLLSFSDEMQSFKIVNLSFGVLFCIAIFIMGGYEGRGGEILALLLSLCLFFSPLRFVPFYPVYTDPPFLALTAISILFFLKRIYALSFLFMVLAYPVREAALIVLVFIGAAAIYIEGFSKKIWIYFLISLCISLIIKYFISNYFDCHGSQWNAALGEIKSRLQNPSKFIAFGAAIMLTAAPVLIMEKLPDDKLGRVYLAGMIFAAALAFVGGSDSTRIFYSFLPLYVLLIVRCMKSRGFYFAMFCTLSYVVTNQIGRKIAEPVAYWPNKETEGFFGQFPDHASAEVSMTIIAVWLIIFYVYNKFIQFRTAPS